MNRYWRSLVTSLCFIAFGVGGTLLSAIFFPLLMLSPEPPERKHRRARVIVRWCFGVLVRVLQGSGCMKLVVEGLPRLGTGRGMLIVANHPSYIDIVVLLSLVPNANCVVKGAHWRNPFYWSIVRSAGYIRNNSPEELVDACATALEAGETLVLFPEGTRTVPGREMKFQRGAAHVALKGGALLAPVLISCNPATLSKGEPWWRAPETFFTFRVAVQEPVGTDYFVSTPVDSPVGARRLTDALQNYFSLRMNSDGYA